jgi:hypothetical protein
LKTLLLNANQIFAVVPNAFAKCTGLQELGVGANPFTFLPTGAFAGLTSLKRISINTCPNLEIIQTGALPLDAISAPVEEVRLIGNKHLTVVEADFLTGV